jgi:segregation and condensation protein B
VGHREVPGRPALYSTTKSFLDDLKLRSLDELPPLDELGTLLEVESPPRGEPAGAPALEEPAQQEAQDETASY